MAARRHAPSGCHWWTWNDARLRTWIMALWICLLDCIRVCHFYARQELGDKVGRGSPQEVNIQQVFEFKNNLARQEMTFAFLCGTAFTVCCNGSIPSINRKRLIYYMFRRYFVINNTGDPITLYFSIVLYGKTWSFAVLCSLSTSSYACMMKINPRLGAGVFSPTTVMCKQTLPRVVFFTFEHRNIRITLHMRGMELRNRVVSIAHSLSGCNLPWSNEQ